MSTTPKASVASLASAASIAAARYVEQIPRTAAIVKRFVDAPMDTVNYSSLKRAKAQAYGRLRTLRQLRDDAAEELFDAILRGDA